ncbi:MAG: hypothetical protein ACPGVH_08105, partial [Chitinophagales bacterium]
FVIIVTSLHEDFLPSSWLYFLPTWVDVAIYVGTLGIFMTLFLLFTRAFPVIAIAEVKSIFSSSSALARKRQIEENGDDFESKYGEAEGMKYKDLKYNVNTSND